MTTIKKYFLCLLTLNFLCLNAMRNEEFLYITADDCVERISMTIDTNHLGMSNYPCYRPLNRAIWSYSFQFLPIKDVTTEMDIIETYIPSYKNDLYTPQKPAPFIPLPQNDTYKRLVFRKLVEKHPYVGYLMQKLTKDKFEQFKNVKGSTIDKLLNPDFTSDSNGKQEMVYKQAHEQFFNWANIGYNPPKQMAYLCTEAFRNNRDNYHELAALNNSESLKKCSYPIKPGTFTSGIFITGLKASIESQMTLLHEQKYGREYPKFLSIKESSSK